MPSGPFADIQGEVKDLLHQSGWPGTVYNDDGSTSGGDWVDRGTETDDFDAGTAITIRVEWPRAANTVRSPSGREISGDVIIVVDPDEATFTSGDEETLPSEIVDEDSGERYRVLRVIDEHTGVLRLDCEHLS